MIQILSCDFGGCCKKSWLDSKHLVLSLSGSDQFEAYSIRTYRYVIQEMRLPSRFDGPRKKAYLLTRGNLLYASIIA